MTGIDKRLPRTGFRKFQPLDWSQDTGPSVHIQAHWVMLTPLKLGGQGLACFSNLPHSVCFMPNNNKHSSDPHCLALCPHRSPLSKLKSSSDMTFPINLSWFLFPIEGNTPRAKAAPHQCFYSCSLLSWIDYLSPSLLGLRAGTVVFVCFLICFQHNAWLILGIHYWMNESMFL